MDSIELHHFEQLFARLIQAPVNCAHCHMLVDGEKRWQVVGGATIIETCSLFCATKISPQVQRVLGCSTTIKKV